MLMILKNVEDALENLQSNPIEKEGYEKHVNPEQMKQPKTERPRKYRPFDPLREAQTKYYANFFTVTVKMNDKRKLNPYALRAAIEVQTGATPVSITTSGRDAFTIKIKMRSRVRR